MVWDIKKIYPKEWVSWKHSEFATKQLKMYFTTRMRNIGLIHIYIGNNYEITIKFKTYWPKSHIYYPTKRKIATQLILRQNLAQILPKLGKSLHKHCSQAHTFFHLCVQCRVHKIQCRLYSVKLTRCIAYYNVYSIQGTGLSTHSTIYRGQCKVCCVHCTKENALRTVIIARRVDDISTYYDPRPIRPPASLSVWGLDRYSLHLMATALDKV